MGNLFTALLSWLSVKSRGGVWVLRIEDLDPQRSRYEYGRLIEDDLMWLGLEWDEGGLDGKGAYGPYVQSERHGYYEKALEELVSRGLVYPCSCTRADILSTQAPHASDGRVVYNGRCRPRELPPMPRVNIDETGRALRIWTPDAVIKVRDTLAGEIKCNLALEWGDFMVRRADGAWSYQLAVVVDDALMGITEVVRGNDLIYSSAPQQYLAGLLSYTTPEWYHVPLVVNSDGIRLSKRDKGAAMDMLRLRFNPREIVGQLAFMAGLIPEYRPVTPSELLPIMNWHNLPITNTVKYE